MMAETKQLFRCPQNLDYGLRLDCPNWQCPQAAECFRDKWPDISDRYLMRKATRKPQPTRPPCGNCTHHHSADCSFDRKFRDVMTPTDASCIDFEPVAKGRFTR